MIGADAGLDKPKNIGTEMTENNLVWGEVTDLDWGRSVFCF